MSQETTPRRSAEEETGLHGPAGISDPFPGEYRLVRRLGAGAFGEVWLADDLSPLRWQVALKFLRGSNDRLKLARSVLENEARVLGSLRHPNIVRVLAWRQVAATGMPCLVMEYILGGSFEHRVEAHGPLPWQQAARYVADIADGLLTVHKKGLIHRDVKPANLLWGPEKDEALLTDFGIAARLADPRTVAGTPRFMAPEAHRGDVSPALDVFGLAASLFWLVTRQAPFAGEDLPALIQAMERGLPWRDDRFAGLPGPLEELLRAALAPSAHDRPDLATFVRDLRGTLNALLADCLTLSGAKMPPPSSAAGPPQVQILVSRQVGSHFEPVASSMQSSGVLRDLQRVPRPPDRVTVHTGDWVRIEVRADQTGYLTVFNVGPSGNLNLLWPAEPGQAAPLQPAHQVLPILEVRLTPPAGRERLFAVWTRSPLPLRLEDLRSLAGQDLPEQPAGGRAYSATRDMALVQKSLQQLPSQDRHVVVLELEHLQ